MYCNALPDFTAAMCVCTGYTSRAVHVLQTACAAHVVWCRPSTAGILIARWSTGWRLDSRRKPENMTALFCRRAATLAFLADRTNGRAIGTVLLASVVRRRLSSVTWSIVAKRCVLEQKLLLAAYRKSYIRNRLVPNEWHWPLFRGRSRSCQPVRRRYLQNYLS